VNVREVLLRSRDVRFVGYRAGLRLLDFSHGLTPDHPWAASCSNRLRMARTERRFGMDVETVTELPDVVAAFVRAVNEGQHEALLKTFAEDALVNDQLTEHRGVSAISTWASGEVMGQRLVMRVRRAVTHSEQTVVTATVDGSFDKRGLPDPLVVTFYFSVRDNQLVQLIVLRNDRDT
jgi:hypothetical protein